MPYHTIGKQPGDVYLIINAEDVTVQDGDLQVSATQQWARSVNLEAGTISEAMPVASSLNHGAGMWNLKLREYNLYPDASDLISQVDMEIPEAPEQVIES